MSTTSSNDIEGIPNDQEPPPTEEDGSERVDDEAGKAEEVVEEEEIPEVFLSEDFISRVYLSENCTIPDTFIEFDHSYGYDCKKYFNICVADEDIIVFSSGCLIHFFNATTNELTFRRSAGGGGIGHIIKNPVLPHIAIGEKGTNPLIIIYEWPSLDIVCILKQGTMTAYSRLDYSPDGSLLCSQGDSPDYMLTIWNWQKSKIMLRRKAYSQNVVNVMFSPYSQGQLSSGGTGHIKFWKIALTFTGLKLTGELGRFGKTEMSDIIGILPLPDEKVVSGCEWGNMLVWEGGLIKVEVFKKNRKPCHAAPITQIEYNKGELTTIGLDGVIKFWSFETIDQADPPDDDRVIEVEPIYELKVGSLDDSAQLMAIVKIKPDNPDDKFWFTQDGNGGIWKVQLDTCVENPLSKQIIVCHAGPVMDIATSSCGKHLASIGKDGRIFFYNYVNKEILVKKQFRGEGRCILWLPVSVERSGRVLLAGYGDGVLRVMVVHLLDNKVTLIQATKAHTKCITALTINPKGNLIVTGSEDATIFIHVITPKSEYITLTPMGFIAIPSAVTFINWKPKSSATIIVCCQRGQFLEIVIPEGTKFCTEVSYELKDIPYKILQFKSVKSQLRRDIKLKEIEERKMKKREKKKEKLEIIRKENSGFDIDEATFLEDSEEDEELEPLYFPEAPNPILFAMYTIEGTICLSVGGYDSGYLYEYHFEKEGPVRCTMVDQTDGTEIQSYVYCYNKKYIVFGMHDGKVRVIRVNPHDFSDLKDYLLLPMHDNVYGRIRRICFSFDQNYMFTCGDDGNIFAFLVNPEERYYVGEWERSIKPFQIPERDVATDIDDESFLSLEEAKQKLDYERRMKIANDRKSDVIEKIVVLAQKYREIINRNNALPQSQRLRKDDLEIDSRITKSIELLLYAEFSLLERKLAYKAAKCEYGLNKMLDYFLNILESFGISVIAIDHKCSVSTFRNRHVFPEYLEVKRDVDIRIAWDEAKGRIQETPLPKRISVELQKKPLHTDAFLNELSLEPYELKKHPKIKRLLNKYVARRRKLEARKKEVQTKPDPSVNHPFDAAAIELIEFNFGDYKLKSAEDYSVPTHLIVGSLKKYDEILETRLKIFNIKASFNRKVILLRQQKIDLIEEIKDIHKELDTLRVNIGQYKLQTPRGIPAMISEVELLDETFKILVSENVMQKKKQAQCEKKKKNKLLTYKMEDIVEMVMKREKQSCLESVEKVSVTNVFKNISSKEFITHSHLSISDLEMMAFDDATSTSWELDTNNSSIIEKLDKYNRLCRSIDYKINKFDNKVKSLYDQSRQIEIQTKFLEIHMIKLNQELVVMLRHESKEQYLSQNVTKRLRERHTKQVKILLIQTKIDQKLIELTKIFDKMNDITTKFINATCKSKYAKYLRKIYSKKYRPPRNRGSDSESSTSSDSESDSEDEQNYGSDDIDHIQLEEKWRPVDCEEDLYNLAFTLRSERYQTDIKIARKNEVIDGLRKKLSLAENNVKRIENALKTSQVELEVFLRFKQKKLNEVDCLLILKLDQFSNFINKSSNKLEIPNDSLLFDKTELEKLYCREEQIIKETECQKAQYFNNRSHLVIIKRDINVMKEYVANLKESIINAQKHKFNCLISLDVLEEAVLRLMVGRMRSSVPHYREQQDSVLSDLNRLISDKKNNFNCAVKSRTEKLNTLYALEKEKQYLFSKLRFQSELVKSTDNYINPYLKENKILSELTKQQLIQIQDLKNEIDGLRQKAKCPAIKRGEPFPDDDYDYDDDDDMELVKRDTFSIKDSDKSEEQFTVVTNQIYMQALMDEVIHSLPEGMNVGSWISGGMDIAALLDQEIDLPSQQNVYAVKQMIEQILEKLPTQSREEFIIAMKKHSELSIAEKTDTKDGDTGETKQSATESFAAVKEILFELLEDPVGIKTSLEEVIENLVGEDELTVPGISTRQLIDEAVDKIVDQHLDTGGEYVQDLVAQVVTSLESLKALPPDVSNVTDVIVDIIKTSILDKLELRTDGNDDVPNDDIRDVHNVSRTSLESSADNREPRDNLFEHFEGNQHDLNDKSV